ncbi:MAG: Hint domain-containing protein [Cypionkella sp.]
MATLYSGLGGPRGYGEGNFHNTPTGSLTAGNYDDGSIKVDITSVFGASGINYFGTNYTSMYINTNGLITFNAPVTAYTPSALASLPYPAIAAFWSDVDIRAGALTGSNNIYWDLDPVNGDVTITWDSVKRYSGNGNNTFQVRLHSTGKGNFEIEFIYGTIQWTNGYAGVAQTGFTNGGAIDYVLPGSGNSTALSQYPTANLDPGSTNGTWSQHFWNGAPICFAAGTRIATPLGPRLVESLRIGDLVNTLDHGPQPLRWVGEWQMMADMGALPIQIAAHSLGNDHLLRVSPQHLLMIEGADCEMLFGDAEVLVSAKDLVGLPGITAIQQRQRVHYHHLMFDRHQIIFAEGAPAESLHPGPMTMAQLPNRQAADMATHFVPWELERLATQAAARRILRGAEATVLRDWRLQRANATGYAFSSRIAA